VTAEGIETVAQADAAFAYGAHQGQGFLFSEAVPADRVPQLLVGFPQANSLREKKLHDRESVIGQSLPSDRAPITSGLHR
jgi:predicted signal transduction protein with EAL and GGDEF domain